jgi:diaminohydroxyphosphoribosylaminopyrimidine deaminase/5-amino-6-(5-phosphoribosylamino)uracil reductase
LKWAESQDGFISPKVKAEQKPVWITNAYSRQLVHKWRSEEQAILVGTQTVIDDNPKLDVRDWTGNNPIRIVLDQHNRIEKESHVFDNQIKTIVFVKKIPNIAKENLIFEYLDFGKNIEIQLVARVYKHQIQSVIIEGGLQTLQTFIDANLWDEARVFKGNVFLQEGTKAPIISAFCLEKQIVNQDELLIFKNHD